MKKTNMLFRRLEVGEMIEKKDYALTKLPAKGNMDLCMECVLDEPSLWVSRDEQYPFKYAYSNAGSLVKETDGNYHYRRIL